MITDLGYSVTPWQCRASQGLQSLLGAFNFDHVEVEALSFRFRPDSLRDLDRWSGLRLRRSSDEDRWSGLRNVANRHSRLRSLRHYLLTLNRHCLCHGRFAGYRRIDAFG